MQMCKILFCITVPHFVDTVTVWFTFLNMMAATNWHSFRN